MEAEDKELCLQWNSHSEVFQSTFGQLLNSEDFADVTLSCQDRTIKCHKVVLSICSSYFRSLLLQHDHPHPLVILSDVKYEDLEYIIKFMYTGEITVPQSQLGSLVNVADILKVKGLAETENEIIPQSAQPYMKRKRKDPSQPSTGDDSDLVGRSESPVPSKKPSKGPQKDKSARQNAQPSTPSQSSEIICAAVPVKTETLENPVDMLDNVRDDNENIDLHMFKVKPEEGEGEQTLAEQGMSILQSVVGVAAANRGPRYTPDDLEKAIMEVLYGTNSITSAAKAYNIPVASLFRRVKRLGIQSKFVGTTNRPKNRPRLGLNERVLLPKPDADQHDGRTEQNDARSSSPPQLFIDESIEQSSAYQAGLQVLSSNESLE